jgi:hypothetical protein
MIVDAKCDMKRVINGCDRQRTRVHVQVHSKSLDDLFGKYF